MMLYRLISWPYVRKHALRSAMTVASSAIGVAVFFAMHAANQVVSSSFQNTVLKIAGSTQIQISAGETGFGEDVLERVQSLDAVAVAGPVIEAVASAQAGQGNLLILGVDLTGDRALREYTFEGGDAAIIDDPLVFLAQPDSIIVTFEYARRNHLKTDSKITLDTAAGPRTFTVRGILRSTGFASAFGGNLAVMDIYAAQQAFGRGRRFDRIDVVLEEGIPLREGEQRLRAALGPGFVVQPPATRGQSVESVLRSYSFILDFSSGFALLVGIFIIYSSFSVSVTQRRREIGVLRALGATRRQIVLLFLGESALSGLVGSAAGVVAGYAATGAMAGAMAGFVQGAYGAASGELVVAPSWSWMMLAMATGAATSVLAGVLPARAAAQIDPILALQKGRQRTLREEPTAALITAAALSTVAGVLLLFLTRTKGWLYVGYVCLLLAAVFLTPSLVKALGRMLRPLLRTLRPVEGALAADSLIDPERGTASTAGALMLSLALAVGFAGTALSTYRDVMDWVTAALNADLFVTASPELTGNNYRLPASMEPELMAIDGVEDVYRVRTPRIEFQGTPVLLVAVEMEKRSVRSPPKTVAGDPATMYKLAASGQGVIVSENLAALRGLNVGEWVELPAPGGVLRLPVAGIVREYGDLQGEIMLDWPLFEHYWNDDTVDQFRVFVRPGVDPGAVRNVILKKYEANRRLFVLFNREVRTYIGGVTDQWFGITWVQLAVAVIVAILGIVNALTVAVADRRRELGVLQAVGGLRRQIRVTICMEAVGIAVTGLILGFALGAVQLYCLLELSARDFPGLRFDYIYPYEAAALLSPIILLAAVLSAAGPAEVAVRSSLVEALEYE